MESQMAKPYNVLEKAKSDSVTQQNQDTFNKVEARFTEAQKAKIRGKLAKFRAEAGNMGFFQLSTEKHSSKLLGDFMRAMNMPRPGARWEAHHIVSGDHPEAEEARAVLASDDIKMRIDDPDNGCWMPKTKADARPTNYPNAIGHNRIHRDRYYAWIFSNIVSMPNIGLVIAFLGRVRQQLLQGNLRDDMILQQEIDEAEYYYWMKKNK